MKRSVKRQTDLGTLLVTLAALALIPATFFDVLQGIGAGYLADEIRITVDGDTDRVRFSGRLGDGIDQGLEERQNGHSWRYHRLFATSLFLHADAEALAAVRSVTVQIAGRKKVWSHEELLRDWKQGPTPPLYRSDRREVLTLQCPDAPAFGSQMGFWRGWFAAMQWGAKTPLICFAILILLTQGVRWWARRSESRGVIDACLQTQQSPPPKAPSERSATRIWFASGFAFVAVALTWLEYSQPLYFTQDDNFAQFLPVILQGCGAVFQGHLPLWNPYQLFGAATLTLGTYALTYPGTYLSYAIAKFILGDERLTIEVFAILHLLAGYAAMFWLLRQQRIRSVLACTGAVCFVLSGFFLEAGRSWFYMLPVALWVPLLFGTGLKLLQGKFSWWLTLATGCILGAFFHAGNAQMWIYAVLFLLPLTTILAITRTVPWKNAARLIPALLCGIAIAAPLLIWQSAETADLDRQGGQGHFLGERGALGYTVLPLGPLISNDRWGGINFRYSNEVYFCGTLFVLATALGLVCLLAFQRQRRGEKLSPLLSNNFWLPLALIAFIYALGPAGVVWTITALLPVFNKLNGAMKFIAFFNLFAIVGGALVCQRLLKNRPRIMRHLAFATLALTVLHVLFARGSFYSYADRHYINPPEPIESLLSSPVPQRFLPVAAIRSTQNGFSSSLSLNFSTAAGQISALGYDPLVEQTPANERVRKWLYSNPPAAAQALGISWVLLHHTAIEPPDDNDEQVRPALSGTDQQLYHLFLEQTDRVVRAGDFTLIHIPGSSPLAFSTSSPDRSLPVQWNTEGAEVDITGLPTGAQVTVNVLARPWLRFWQNGHELATTSDKLGRPSTTVMVAQKTLLLRYSPPLRQPLTIALALMIAALVSAALLQRFAETGTVPVKLNRAPGAVPEASPYVSA